MRARLALQLAQINYEIREIELKAKPASMLRLSPKGTVPVFCLPNGQVLEQSLDIMLWAIQQTSQAQQLLGSHLPNTMGPAVQHWIDLNDQEFKPLLDRYKYPNRYPEKSQLDYCHQGLEKMLQPMNLVLSQQAFLGGAHFNLADIALLPFVRQFSKVNDEIWQQLELPSLKKWLEQWLLTAEFDVMMQKNPVWQGD
jgi:glutathione S-transferase